MPPESPRARIVIADDHPAVLEAVKALLERSCDVVAAVGDGAEALAAVERLDPDVVILDLAMPRLNGFQAARAIRSRGHRLPAVFLSAHAEDESIVEGLAYGQAFVSKHCMNSELVDAVRHVRAGRLVAPAARILPRLNRPRSCRHDLHLYGDDASLVESVAGYFASALHAGDSVVALATASHLRDIETAMRATAFRMDRLIAEGRYTTVDMAVAVQAIMVDGKPDTRRFACWLDPIVTRGSASAPSRSVTIFGEMAPSLAESEMDAALALEQMGDEFAASRGVAILCGYGHQSGAVRSRQFESISAVHAAVVHARLHA